MDVKTLQKPVICQIVDLGEKLKDNSESKIEMARKTQARVHQQDKKDHKRPELQIYRPGMGLQNRCNSKLEEPLGSPKLDNMSNSPDRVVKNETDVKCSNSKSPRSSKSRKSGHNCSESLKPFTKNRRPDIQVYIPKPKVAAKLEEIKKKNNHSSEFLKCSMNFESMPNDIVENKHSESNSISNKGKHTAVCSEIKRLSNSQGDDKQILNDGIKHTNFPECEIVSTQQGPSASKFLNNQSESNEYDLKNSLTGGYKWSCIKEKGSVYDKEKEDKQNVSKSLEHRTNHNKTREFVRGSAPSAHSETVDLLITNGDNVMLTACDNERNVHKNSYYHNSNLGSKECLRKISGDILNGDNSASEVDRGKIDCETNGSGNYRRDRRDSKVRKGKMDYSPPPRFQEKNKILQKTSAIRQSLGKSSSEKLNTGGILRVPLDSLSPELSCESSSGSICDKKFQEPFVFVHKHLFDPNNPNIPEIVNVPAPIKAPFPAALNCRTQPNLIYKPSPSDLHPSSAIYDFGYIPPPRPLTIQHPHKPENVNFPVHDISRGLNITESTASILPPVAREVVNLASDATFVKPVVSRENSPPQDAGKRRVKPTVEKNLKIIAVLERDLASCLSEGIMKVDMDALGQCRWKLQLRYEKIILADPRYCAEKNVEQNLWKTVFHQIIESLRNSIEKQEDKKNELARKLMNVVDEGIVFYEHLLEKQEETFGFKLSEVPVIESLRANGSPDLNGLVLISCQKSFIYLGDLARYKEQASGKANYGTARSWYLKAQQIAPKNGRPYNQLALLALHARRKLDAVYYYMRSLAASNPFLSARESLLSLFEGARKKYEQWEKRRLEESDSHRRIERNDNRERCEIWFKPDGSTTKQTSNPDQSSEVTELSTVELNKRFVASFLHVHGKLFTKVGMETFTETVKQMLTEFHELLQRKPLAMRSSRLLQLLAINMFTVANASTKNPLNSPNSFLQEQALQVSLATMSSIMERCCSLHKEHLESFDSSCQLISDEFVELLPAVKIWTDWMSCQKELWSPPPLLPTEEFRIGYEKDIWSSFANFLTTLRKIDPGELDSIHEKREGYEPLILDEDVTLAGFVPLLGAVNDVIYMKPPFDMEKAKHSLRINKIQFFGDYLCGIATPYLEYEVEHKKFMSLVNLQCEKEMYIPTNIPWDAMNEDLITEDTSDELVTTLSPTNDAGDDEIQQLWSKIEALNKAKEQQEKYNAQVQFTLQSIQYQLPTVLQIQPKYLIPDTNCFIDHLDAIRNLLSSMSFIIIVPLVVVNELDGLAQGTRMNPHISPQHANKVTTLSREAISFLEHQFAEKHPHLRAITSKGSILDSISFRFEDISDIKDSNDDLILECCLYYCKDRPRAHGQNNADSPIQLFREVVLLTDDKILRMKALTHNVPARDILAFLTWATS